MDRPEIKNKVTVCSAYLIAFHEDWVSKDLWVRVKYHRNDEEDKIFALKRRQKAIKELKQADKDVMDLFRGERVA